MAPILFAFRSIRCKLKILQKNLDRNVIEIEAQVATVCEEGSVSHPLGKVDVSWKLLEINMFLLTMHRKELKLLLILMEV